ncbi:HD-GYP domain-containing protein [Candidatus Omnitrophota bacterium]
MPIDYKKELESAAKSMILVHEPDTLIKMIARMMVQKVKVMHTGILLHDEQKKTYILRVSRGAAGIKIPPEFARMDYANPLISFFRERQDKQILGDGVIIYSEAKELLDKQTDLQVKQILGGALAQMEMLEAVICIPSYFREDLLGVLFLGKKKSGEDFQRTELDFFVALASDVAMAIRNAKLFKQLQNELAKRRELFLNTTISLSAAIEAKDRYTQGHTTRVTNICLELGKKIMETKGVHFKDNFLEDLHIAALLHDIGKIGVPEDILNKKGLLDEEEWKKMKLHPEIGANILQSIKELELAIQGVKYHHERYDGKGYPDGLDNEKIPIIAAIISVADAYDAMTSDRPYRNAKSRQEAISEIKQESGKQFHPSVVSAFLQLCREGKI